MGWMPGLVYKPGRNAENYGNRKQCARLHYTVGIDSTGIGLNGYFHFLIPKFGTPLQFAPTEAVCWDACEWNPAGVGIEFERLSDEEPLTDSQIGWGGAIIRWLAAEDGYPLVFRDSPGDRLPVGDGYRGFLTHRSLHENACDEHYDYVSQQDWDRMVVPVPPLPPPPTPILTKEHPMFSVVDSDGTVWFWVIGRSANVYRQSKPKGKDWTTFEATGAIAADPEPTKV